MNFDMRMMEISMHGPDQVSKKMFLTRNLALLLVLHFINTLTI